MSVGRIYKTIRGFGKRLSILFKPPLESLPDAPNLFRLYRSHYRHPELKRKPGGWLYRGEFYPDYLTIGGASHAIFRVATRYCKGSGIDVGAGFWQLPDATPVDIKQGPGLGKIVADFADDSLDYVFSSHCLEHIADWQKALLQWISKLHSGGVLFLYLPHPECGIWLQGSPFIGDAHKWIPTPEIVKSAVQQLGCDIIAYDDGPDAMYSFYVCAKKI
jgi:SAM-dependent methyltransferase